MWEGLKVVLESFLFDSDRCQSFLPDKKNALLTDGPTDQWTDKPSYRDAWTHLKMVLAVVLTNFNIFYMMPKMQ